MVFKPFLWYFLDRVVKIKNPKHEILNPKPTAGRPERSEGTQSSFVASLLRMTLAGAKVSLVFRYSDLEFNKI